MNTIEDLATIDLASLVNGHYLDAEQNAETDGKDPFCDQWEIFGLADAYAEREPWRYLVDGLLPYPSLNACYGGPGSLKSMLLADLAACVAGGQPWLQSIDGPGQTAGVSFRVEHSPVLWIDFDNGVRRTHERIESVARCRGLPADAPLHYVSMPRPWLDIGKMGMVESLARKIKALGAKMIVIDNLGLITGDTEENSAGMAQVMGNLRWLCQESESCVIVVHHQRKSSGIAGGAIRKGETLRGHSSIEAALDTALLVERTPGEDKVAVLLTKVRGYVEHQLFGAMFTYQHREGTHDLESARFFSQAVDSAAVLENMYTETIIMRVLGEYDELNQTQLVTKVRDTIAAATPRRKVPGANTVRGLIDQLAKDGDIAVRVGDKNAKYYAAAGA